MRTRLSFEVAVSQLGGQTIFMGPDSGVLGGREATRDVAKVCTRYLDGIVMRTKKHETIAEMARYAGVPVVNGLSDEHHPCQALGDLLTIREKVGRIAGVKVAYIGDANNVCRSLAHALSKCGAKLSVASPEKYGLPEAFLKSLGANHGVEQGGDPAKAVENADVIYTDTWVSMGQEQDAAWRRVSFAGYQVNDTLMSVARPDAIFMHCLPAHRGEEVTDEVLDGPQSIVVEQAENRLHLQKALMVELVAGSPPR
jgi:ornithine carbamoyltransferase